MGRSYEFSAEMVRPSATAVNKALPPRGQARAAGIDGRRRYGSAS